MNTSKTPIILVTGAARSGKSEWAEYLAEQSGKMVTYIATADHNEGDLEWQARIAQHQHRRPSHWQTLEITSAIAPTIAQGNKEQCFLIDSLGTWVANLLHQEEQQWQTITRDFFTSLQTSCADTILVGEETGWGVVPAYESGRLFRDRLGNLIRHLGAIATDVYLVTGGHALNLTHLGHSLSSVKSQQGTTNN